MYKKQKLLFHGTNISSLNKILTEGLAIKYGRATLTTNLKYASIYAQNFFKKNGVFLIYKKKNNIKIAIDSKIKIDHNKKTINGYPNRYKTEQYGFFSKKRYINKKDIVGIYLYDKNLLKILNIISKKIISGNISQKDLNTYSLKLKKILNNQKIEILKPNISLKDLIENIVNGMIENITLREIRTYYLTKLNKKGYKIISYGNHPIKLSTNLSNSLKNLSKIVRKNFISNRIKQEYCKLLS